MSKIVIVMTYFNRLGQLERTLESIKRTKHDDYEIVIVDDKSYEAVNFSQYSERIHTVRVGEEKDWCNPVVAYNLGIHRAIELSAEIIILQNAECYHYGDILSHAAQHVHSTNYLSYAALSLDEEHTKREVIDGLIAALLPVEFAVPYNPLSSELGWYNHSRHLPRALDFCSAITVENLRRINGYDERYAKHIWYGDDDLLHRIRQSGLTVEIVDEPFVVHQWHDHNHITEENSVDNGFDLFQTVLASNNYRAVHTYTKNFDE